MFPIVFFLINILILFVAFLNLEECLKYKGTSIYMKDLLEFTPARFVYIVFLILLNLFSLSTFYNLSNHIIISLDIVFFFSMLIIIMFRRIKILNNTPKF